MDVKRVKELIELMKANDLSELKMVDGEFQVSLKRSYGLAPGLGLPEGVASNMQVVPQAVVTGPAPVAEQTAGQEGKTDDLKKIISPMVGTFYAAPSPNAEAFVKEGSAVDEETVVCIIEAMKVMNEIKSEMKGTIKEVLVSNGTAVEFGQSLYRVAPD